MVSGCGSFMVTVNEHVAVAPPPSVAIQLTVVVPIRKFEPDGGGKSPRRRSSCRSQAAQSLPCQCILPDCLLRKVARTVIRGAGLLAVVALATLLLVFRSGVVGLKAIAVLL
jgi:hypothetical protein